MWHQITMVTSEQHLYKKIVQFDKTIVLPRKLSTGSIHDYPFCYCPLVGLLFEVLRMESLRMTQPSLQLYRAVVLYTQITTDIPGFYGCALRRSFCLNSREYTDLCMLVMYGTHEWYSLPRLQKKIYHPYPGGYMERYQKWNKLLWDCIHRQLLSQA